MDRHPIPGQRNWSPMKYHQVDLKLDQFIQYVNDGKINLIPLTCLDFLYQT